MIPQANRLNQENTNRQPIPSLDRVSEARLLAEVKRGKPEAFQALSQHLMPRLYNAALHITRNHEDAEDALQDALLSAFIHIRKFHGKSSFSTWLTRIVINSALMVCRKRHSSRYVSADDFGTSEDGTLTLQIPDHSPNPEQRYVENERKRLLHKAIGGLRPRIRAVIQVGQLQERPIKETAQVLDISVAAAKGRFFHARAVLRKSVALRAIAKARTEPAA